MRLRIALASDLPDLQKIYVETIEEICSRDYDQAQVDVWKSTVENTGRWHAMMNEQLVVVAEKNNKIVGFGTLRDGNYIDFFYIHKDFQRLGIAQNILLQLEIQARKSGNFYITSDVSITARLFFEKNGFVILKEQKNLRKGVELINYKMEKKLSS